MMSRHPITISDIVRDKDAVAAKNVSIAPPSKKIFCTCITCEGNFSRTPLDCLLTICYVFLRQFAANIGRINIYDVKTPYYLCGPA